MLKLLESRIEKRHVAVFQINLKNEENDNNKHLPCVQSCIHVSCLEDETENANFVFDT